MVLYSQQVKERLGVPRRQIKQLNWGAERRNEFIEFRVFWHGRINRSDLMETFGISLQQASLDLTGYAERWKRNLVYDKSQRAYVRGRSFKPHFIKPSAEDYLAQLRALDQGLVSREQSWICLFPGYGTTPTPARGIAPETLREVLTAIHEPSALEVTYQSMSRPEPSTRWIEPHSLAFDGFRWHARAFCQNDQVFKDFLLSRIVAIGKQGPVTTDPQRDVDWHTEVVLEIGPHPDLSPTQRRAIEMDYGMENGRAQFPVRKALLFYALKRLGLDTDPAARRPQDQQIILISQNSLPKVDA